MTFSPPVKSLRLASAIFLWCRAVIIFKSRSRWRSVPIGTWPFESEPLVESRMYPAAGSDIFVYPRGLFGTVPPFAIGRGYWDNWLIRRSVELEASVIDATGTVVAVHQDHDYRHVSYVPSRQPERGGRPGLRRRSAQFSFGGRTRLPLRRFYDATELLMAEVAGSSQKTLRPFLIWRRIKAWLRRIIAISAPVVLLWSVLFERPRPSQIAGNRSNELESQ